MTSTQKAAWQTPKLQTLAVDRTLTGAATGGLELFDSNNNLSQEGELAGS